MTRPARLLAILSLLLALVAPVAARAMPAMACCAPQMAMAHQGHGHDGHTSRDRRDDAGLPGDASGCATVAAIVTPPVMVSVAALPPVAPPAPRGAPRLIGLDHAAEPRPPRLSA